jgi:hypothetical protein
VPTYPCSQLNPVSPIYLICACVVVDDSTDLVTLQSFAGTRWHSSDCSENIGRICNNNILLLLLTVLHYCYYFCYYWGLRWRSWLRHCATNRQVADSILDGAIGYFHWHNPFCRTMALGSTHPLTEMSTRKVSWGGNAPGAYG